VIFTQYRSSVFIREVWLEIFPTFNVANCDQSVVKFCCRFENRTKPYRGSFTHTVGSDFINECNINGADVVKTVFKGKRFNKL